jgi:hypothetical protein
LGDFPIYLDISQALLATPNFLSKINLLDRINVYSGMEWTGEFVPLVELRSILAISKFSNWHLHTEDFFTSLSLQACSFFSFVNPIISARIILDLLLRERMRMDKLVLEKLLMRQLCVVFTKLV